MQYAIDAPPVRSQSEYRAGFVLGLMLVASLYEPSIGLPALVIWLLCARRLAIRRTDQWLLVILLAKIVWIALLWASARTLPFLDLMKVLGVDLMLLPALFLRNDERFFRGMAWPLITLFLVDLAFNAILLATGVDPLGRALTTRPDDIIPRVGGLFGHPFYSINISVVAILFGKLRRYRLVVLLAVLNVAFNGSFRGWVTLAMGLGVMTMLRWNFGPRKVIVLCVAAAAGVFAATMISAADAANLSGNAMRVFAWRNAVHNIEENPVFGRSFVRGDLPTVDEETIALLGISESAYLDYAVDWGLFPAVAHLTIMVGVLWRALRQYRQQRRGASRIPFFAALLAGVAFIDSFYGTLLGSALTSTVFGLMCLSYQPTLTRCASRDRP